MAEIESNCQLWHQLRKKANRSKVKTQSAGPTIASSKTIILSMCAWGREGIEFIANEEQRNEWRDCSMVTPNLTGTEVKLIIIENISFVFQGSSFPIKRRILKTRIDTKYLSAFCQEKKNKKTFTAHNQKFSESNRTPATTEPSKQEHITPHQNLIALQADTALK